MKIAWPDGTTLHRLADDGIAPELFEKIHDAVRNAMHAGHGLADRTFRACAPGQYVVVWHELKHGLFTAHIAVIDNPSDVSELGGTPRNGIICVIGPRPTDEQIAEFDKRPDMLPEWLWMAHVKEKQPQEEQD